ncbi:MAG: hypothetical protein WCX46_01175 [Candidatus Paceibacterota bacterium]
MVKENPPRKKNNPEIKKLSKKERAKKLVGQMADINKEKRGIVKYEEQIEIEKSKLITKLNEIKTEKDIKTENKDKKLLEIAELEKTQNEKDEIERLKTGAEPVVEKTAEVEATKAITEPKNETTEPAVTENIDPLETLKKTIEELKGRVSSKKDRELLKQYSEQLKEREERSNQLKIIGEKVKELTVKISEEKDPESRKLYLEQLQKMEDDLDKLKSKTNPVTKDAEPTTIEPTKTDTEPRSDVEPAKSEDKIESPADIAAMEKAINEGNEKDLLNLMSGVVGEKEPVSPVAPVPTEKNLIELEAENETQRKEYADAYKKYVKDRKSNSSWFTNTQRTIFGSKTETPENKKSGLFSNIMRKISEIGKVKEQEIPQDLKDIETNYNKTIIECGKKMYAEKQAELEKSGKTPDEQKAELQHYKKTEIFKKIIIEEEQELNKLKAEILPPKTKNAYQKAMNWYLNPKTPRWQKVAVSTGISTAIIASFLPSMVPAGGVATLSYLGIKYGRALAGSYFGQKIGAGGYEKFVKERYSERKEKAKEELSTEFEENITDEQLSEYKKRYAEILENEQKSKRNRTIHKAMAALVVGGAAGLGTGYAAEAGLHHLTPEQILSGGGNVGTHEGISMEHRASISENIKGRGIVDHTKVGGDQTPDLSGNKPGIEVGADIKTGGMQEFMKTNATQNTIKLGMYDPNSDAESMIAQKGTMFFDDPKTGTHIEVEYSSRGAIQTVQNLKAKILENYGGDATKVPDGNISTDYIDMKGIAHHQDLIKGNTVEQYKGDMFDSGKKISGNIQNDNQAPLQENPITGEPINNTANSHDAIPLQENPITGEPIDNTPNGDPIGYQENPITGEPITSRSKDIGLNNNQTPLNQNQTELNNLNQNNTDSINIKTGAENNLIDFDNNPYNLSVEKLDEVRNIYKDNIDKLFNGQEGPWNIIKASTQNYSAEKLMAWDVNNINETYKPFVLNLQNLARTTGLTPRIATIINPIAETPEQFEIRCLQKTAEMGILEKVKL